jgi:hypothetical protein
MFGYGLRVDHFERLLLGLKDGRSAQNRARYQSAYALLPTLMDQLDEK